MRGRTELGLTPAPAFKQITPGSAVERSTRQRSPECAIPTATSSRSLSVHSLLFSSAAARVSGHLNPAVTLGFVVTRRIEPVMAFVYIIAQILAAVLAAYALRGLFPAAVVTSSRLGGQSISLDVSTIQAIVLEFIATFFLVFVVF